MQIAAINAYRVMQAFRSPLPPRPAGNRVEGFDSVIVELITDEGLVGWGEMAPLGAFYSPAFAGGARAGIEELAPFLLGRDPRAPKQIGCLMDSIMNGQPYVKSALDMACCDVAAKAAGVPLATWLGGRFGESVDLYKVLIDGTAENMAADALAATEQGYSRFQIKVGRVSIATAVDRLSAVRETIPRDAIAVCDANAGWSPWQARQFLRATSHLDYSLEQPCATLDECDSVRHATDRPVILDESMSCLQDLLEIHRRRIADGLTLKISRLGGVSKTRLLRDLAVDLGFMVTVEDTGGAEIDTSAMVHLSLSTPQERRMHTSAFHEWVSVRTASNHPAVAEGRISPPDAPGLGIDVQRELLGKPFLQAGRS